MLGGTAPHPATIRWQTTYVDALLKAGAIVTWIGHQPHRTWPWGPMWVDATDDATLKRHRSVPYLNVSPFRTQSLNKGYRQRVRKAAREIEADALVTYNADPWSRSAAQAAAEEGVPWFPIILDFLDPGPDDWGALKATVSGARGVAFVSAWAFEHAPLRHKFLLPGAVVQRATSREPQQRGKERIILYAGSRAAAGGVDRLLEAFSLLQTPNVRLIMTGPGRGYHKDLWEQTQKLSGVSDLGVVSESELEALARRADVLVNPRPISSHHSCMNFPSKLLDYLSYGRPIVSTRAVGLGPCYDEGLVFSESDEPRHIAAAIDHVLGLDDADTARAIGRAVALAERLSPEAAGNAFASWLTSLSRRERKASEANTEVTA